MDICICITESLCCTPETNTTLLIDYTPIYNKKFFKRLNQEEIENLNTLITTSEIEPVVKKLPKNRSPEPDGLTVVFDQTFKKHLIPIILKLVPQNEDEVMLPD